MKIFFRFLTLVCAFAFAFVELAAQNVGEENVGEENGGEENGGVSKNIVGGESDGATPGGRKALLISVSEYVIDESVLPLPGAANDVAAVFERLLKVGFKPEDITVLREPGEDAVSKEDYKNMPTRLAIEDRFERFLSSLRPDDFALIYLSGHGFQKKNEHGDEEAYFASREIESADPCKNSVSINRMMKAFAASAATYRLMIVDACRDVPGKKSIFGRPAPGETRARELGVGAKALKAVENVPEFIVLLQSCASGQQSFEGVVDDGGKPEGFFTRSLLEALDPGSSPADRNADKRLTLKEMVEYVQERTERLAERDGKRQTPDCRLNDPQVANVALLSLSAPGSTDGPSGNLAEAIASPKMETTLVPTLIPRFPAALGALAIGTISALAAGLLVWTARSQAGETFDASAWRTSGLSKRAWRQARRHYAAARAAADDEEFEDALREIGAALAFDDKNADYQYLKSVVEARLDVKRLEEARLEKLAAARRAEEERDAREKEAAKREKRRLELEKLAAERAAAEEKARRAEEARQAEEERLAKAAEAARLAREAEERRLAEETRKKTAVRERRKTSQTAFAARF